MPRGGRRPGAGAPPGNTNAITNGRSSRRALMLVRKLQRHPHRREIIRHMYIEGIFELGRLPTDDDARPDSPTARRFLAFLDAIFFDCSHPLFNQINQINQTPEANTDPDAPLARFTEQERAEIKEQSNNRRLRLEQEALRKSRRRNRTTPP